MRAIRMGGMCGVSPWARFVDEEPSTAIAWATGGRAALRSKAGGVQFGPTVLAHSYFQVNVLQLFGICRDDIPRVIATLRTMIGDLKQSPA